MITHTKNTCAQWDNVIHPCGIVYIINGNEHDAQQYTELAQYLNTHNYIVCIRSVQNLSDTLPIFNTAVQDEIATLKDIKEKYKLPLFLFGHNYGGFIARQILMCTKLCDGVICLSCGIPLPRIRLRIARITTKICRRLNGAQSPARMIHALFPVCTICSHKTQSYEFYYSLFDALLKIPNNTKNHIPMLVINSCDILWRPNTRLATMLYQTYQNHDLENLTVIIYPKTQNELPQDANSDEIRHDILSFLNSVQSHVNHSIQISA